MKKANLSFVLFIAGSILLAVSALSFFALPSLISDEYSWMVLPLSFGIGLAASITVTPMYFSIGDVVAKKKNYSKIPKKLAEDGHGRFYFIYNKEKEPEAVA